MPSLFYFTSNSAEWEGAITTGAITTTLIQQANRRGNGIQVEGRPAAGSSYVEQVEVIRSQYFTTLGMAMNSGCEFDERDRAGLQVAIVSEAMPRKYWPGESPIGRLEVEGPWRQVVGVVVDSNRRGLAQAIAAAETPAPSARSLMAARRPGGVDTMLKVQHSKS